MECVRRVFHEMDEDGSGTLTAEEIAAAVGTHLSPYEVGRGCSGCWGGGAAEGARAGCGGGC